MKIKPIKCPSCGAKLNIQPDSTYCECGSCGSEFYLDNGKIEHVYTKNVNIKKETYHTERYINDAEVIRARTEAKEDKSSLIIVLSLLFLVVVCLAAVFIISANQEKTIETAKSNGMICAGMADDYIDKDYGTVVATFEAAGFTNIETIDLEDSGLRFWKNEKVESVSVGGDLRFGSGDYFPPDTKVVISYH